MTGQSSQIKLRLLIVEDESLIALELEDILDGLGHDVQVCGTVPSAISFVQSRADALDAAIIDANLGGTSALSLSEVLEAQGVPFLVASGYTKEELERLGFQGPCLGKPYRREQIVQALAALMRG